ncbi:hypothetical protein [Nocardia thailandica]|uniref:Uncharacterized protein n=1 Tax=Nocardia thailandica TaxID=257275 RepID=A0ABW6PRT8_9NOCA|nr:hypothetical protein [Nocardia thailandica]
MSAYPYPPARRRGGWGTGAGLVTAVFVFLPASFYLRQSLHLPGIPTGGQPLREVPLTYWLSWAGALGVLAAPAGVAALLPRVRAAASAYAGAALGAGALLAAMVIACEITGFGPS